MPPLRDKIRPGFLTEAFSNPAVSIPYAILSGLGAAATPGTGRLVRGVNAGLGFGLDAEEDAFTRGKSQHLSDAMLKAFSGVPAAKASLPNAGTTAPINLGPSPGQTLTPSQGREVVSRAPVQQRPIGTSSPLEATRLSQALPASGTGTSGGASDTIVPGLTQAFQDMPPMMRNLIKIIAPFDPEAAMDIAAKYVQSQSQDKIVPQGSVLTRGGKETFRNPAAPKAPIKIDVGNETILLDPTTRKVLQRFPKGSAPARQITDQQRELNEAELDLKRKRVEQLDTAIKLLKDPKAKEDQLILAAQRLEDMDGETPEEIENIKIIRTGILRRLADKERLRRGLKPSGSKRKSLKEHFGVPN